MSPQRLAATPERRDNEDQSVKRVPGGPHVVRRKRTYLSPLGSLSAYGSLRLWTTVQGTRSRICVVSRETLCRPATIRGTGWCQRRRSIRGSRIASISRHPRLAPISFASMMFLKHHHGVRVRRFSEGGRLAIENERSRPRCKGRPHPTRAYEARLSPQLLADSASILGAIAMPVLTSFRRRQPGTAN
jgi:hypothetical protein